MAGKQLPDKDSPNIHLVVATAEEGTEMQNDNSEEWRGPLSLEAYVQREAHLANQELTRDGGLTQWALVHQPDPNGPKEILCGCESIKKRALIAQGGSVEDVTCPGICSVFCAPAKRGRGYAGRMMKEVAQRVKGWQADDGKPNPFSVLFSDIGKTFYATHGWRPFSSAHVVLPASHHKSGTEIARPLHQGDLAELCALDEELLRHHLSRRKPTDPPAVAIVPDHRTMLWHNAREEFVSQQLHGKIPTVKGAIVGDKVGSRVWMIFNRVWTNPQEESPNTLHILRLVVEDESAPGSELASPEAAARVQGTEVAQAIAACFRLAQDQAAEWKMQQVSIWNPTAATLAAAQSLDSEASVVHREHESIASLQWYSPDSGDEVEWVYNEKYGWC